MKKLLVIGFSVALFLGACNEETANTAEETSETDAASEETSNAKQEMMRFYMSVSNKINSVDADLNAFENAQTEETLPEGDDLQALKDAAMASAEKTSAAVDEIEIPETLDAQQEEIEAALASIKESYDMKVEELSNEGSFEEANAKFQEADEKFNALLEELELNPSSIYNEVSQ